MTRAAVRLGALLVAVSLATGCGSSDEPSACADGDAKTTYVFAVVDSSGEPAPTEATRKVLCDRVNALGFDGVTITAAGEHQLAIGTPEGFDKRDLPLADLSVPAPDVRLGAERLSGGPGAGASERAVPGGRFRLGLRARHGRVPRPATTRTTCSARGRRPARRAGRGERCRPDPLPGEVPYRSCKEIETDYGIKRIAGHDRADRSAEGQRGAAELRALGSQGPPEGSTVAKVPRG